MWKRKPRIETAVCPTCNMVHQPDHPTGEFRLYCRTHRRSLEDKRERDNMVTAWFHCNFDRLAKQCDAETAEQRAKEAERNQKMYAGMQNAFRPNPYDTNAQASGLGTWTEVFGGTPDA